MIYAHRKSLRSQDVQLSTRCRKAPGCCQAAGCPCTTCPCGTARTTTSSCYGAQSMTRPSSLQLTTRVLCRATSLRLRKLLVRGHSVVQDPRPSDCRKLGPSRASLWENPMLLRARWKCQSCRARRLLPAGRHRLRLLQIIWRHPSADSPDHVLEIRASLWEMPLRARQESCQSCRLRRLLPGRHRLRLLRIIWRRPHVDGTKFDFVQNLATSRLGQEDRKHQDFHSFARLLVCQTTGTTHSFQNASRARKNRNG